MSECKFCEIRYKDYIEVCKEVDELKAENEKLNKIISCSLRHTTTKDDCVDGIDWLKSAYNAYKKDKENKQ